MKLLCIIILYGTNQCSGGLVHKDYELPCPSESKRLFVMIGASCCIILLIALMVKFELWKIGVGSVEGRKRRQKYENSGIYIPDHKSLSERKLA